MNPARLWESAIALAIIMAIGASEARADVTVSLVDPSGVDYSNLAVGQDLTFSVVVSGLTTGQSVTNLQATVGFFNVHDGQQLFTLVSGSPGGIVSDPSQYSTTPYNYSYGTSDEFTVSMRDAGSITSNGTLGTFTVAASAAGSGYLYLSGISVDVGGPTVNIGTYGYTTFTIGAAAVPEPSTALMAGTALAAGLVEHLRRRARRAASRRP